MTYSKLEDITNQHYIIKKSLKDALKNRDSLNDIFSQYLTIINDDFNYLYKNCPRLIFESSIEYHLKKLNKLNKKINAVNFVVNSTIFFNEKTKKMTEIFADLNKNKSPIKISHIIPFIDKQKPQLLSISKKKIEKYISETKILNFKIELFYQFSIAFFDIHHKYLKIQNSRHNESQAKDFEQQYLEICSSFNAMTEENDYTSLALLTAELHKMQEQFNIFNLEDIKDVDASEDNPYAELIQVIRGLFGHLKDKLPPHLDPKETQTLEHLERDVEAFEKTSKMDQNTENTRLISQRFWGLKKQISEYIMKIDFQDLTLKVRSELETLKHTSPDVTDRLNELSAIADNLDVCIKQLDIGKISYTNAFQNLNSAFSLYDAKFKFEVINTAEKIKECIELANKTLTETYQKTLKLKNNPKDTETQIKSLLSELEAKKQIKKDCLQGIHNLNRVMADKLHFHLKSDQAKEIKHLKSKSYSLNEQYEIVTIKKALTRIQVDIKTLENICARLWHAAVKELNIMIEIHNTHRSLYKNKLITMLSKLPGTTKKTDYTALGRSIDETFPELIFDEQVFFEDLVNVVLQEKSQLKKADRYLAHIEGELRALFKRKQSIIRIYQTSLASYKIPLFSDLAINQTSIDYQSDFDQMMKNLRLYITAENETLDQLSEELNAKLESIEIYQADQFFKANTLVANMELVVGDDNERTKNLYTILSLLTKNDPLSKAHWENARVIQKFIRDNQSILDQLLKVNPNIQELTAKFINKYTEFKSKEKYKYTQKEQVDIDQFLMDVLPILLDTKNAQEKATLIEDLAKIKFPHRNWFLRGLADIIQCVFFFIPVYWGPQVYHGNSPFFSSAKTRRVDAVTTVFKSFIQETDDTEYTSYDTEQEQTTQETGLDSTIYDESLDDFIANMHFS